jgi:hypothetical protein
MMFKPGEFSIHSSISDFKKIKRPFTFLKGIFRREASVLIDPGLGKKGYSSQTCFAFKYFTSWNFSRFSIIYSSKISSDFLPRALKIAFRCRSFGCNRPVTIRDTSHSFSPLLLAR